MKITAIIPTFNEEAHIEDAIKSVSFADEIIIIDSYSVDTTVEIAKNFPITLLQRKFDDFSSQKNYAISKSKNDWVFLLDADERVTSELKNEILHVIALENNIDAYWIYRTYYFMGRKIKYSGLQNDKVIRLFKKDTCKYDGKLVHEEIEVDGNIGFLKNKLEHYSYKSFDYHISKLNQYAWLQAEMLFRKNKKANVFHILIKPVYRFFRHYFMKLGFLDGFPGFMIAVTQSYAVLTRYVKLWLLNKNLK